MGKASAHTRSRQTVPLDNMTVARKKAVLAGLMSKNLPDLPFVDQRDFIGFRATIGWFKNKRFCTLQRVK